MMIRIIIIIEPLEPGNASKEVVLIFLLDVCNVSFSESSISFFSGCSATAGSLLVLIRVTLIGFSVTVSASLH